jgi:Cullin family/Cullin protein neddylation domain
MSTRGGPFRSSYSNNTSNVSGSQAGSTSSVTGTGSMGRVNHQHHPNRNIIKKNKKVSSSNATASTSTGGMIKIRPYSKPPQLPSNYYESTAHTMLSGCLSMIQERLKQTQAQNPTVPLSSFSASSSSSFSSSSLQQQQQQQQQPVLSTNSTASSTHNMSLQSAYNTSVDLVRHQFGLRFYDDIVQNMIAASICILPKSSSFRTMEDGTTTGTAIHAVTSTSPNTTASTTTFPQHNHDLEEHRLLLPYITQQYAIYMEYILLLKHICLPLDRTHVWQWTTDGACGMNHPTETNNDDEDFIKSCVGKAATTSTNTSTSMHAPVSIPATSSSTLGASQKQYHQPYQTMWSVGLAIFIRRLQYLHYDRPIYQQWISLFINDWNPTDHQYTSSTTAATKEWNRNEGHDTTTTVKKEERLLLHNIWYMWQDLQILSTLSIQTDLQEYWTKQSVEWQNTTTSSSYSIADFVTFCHDRMQHIHLHYRNIIQPIGWLYHIFDTCFIQHHISVQYLFNDVYFFPLLHEQLFHHTSINSPSSPMPYNTIQQLWILAGRIPNGQVLMSQAIQRYAKQEGLIRLRYTATDNSASSTNAAITANSSSMATTAIEDLLELQYALNMLVQQLPKGAANTLTKNSSTNETSNTASTTLISFKSVWEEVVNVDVFPMSIAEQLAKFLDNTLRSNKKMDTLAHYSNNSTTASANTASTTTSNLVTATTTSSPSTLTTAPSALISEFSWLQRIIHGVFVPLQSKDIFEAFYKRDLAKRLLWNRIISMDAEKYICSLLKAECGTAYTSKIEGMFQDVDWSREIMLVYKQSLLASKLSSDDSTGNDVEVEVQVLTTGYWPVYPVYPSLIIPDTLKIPQEQFESHYHNKHQGRRMVWQYALGHCVVRVNGYNKPYELLVSLCQALVLIQFTSDKICLSLPQLLQATGLDDRGEMERILQSLALGKDGTRILRKLEHTAEPGKKTKILMTIDDRDTFMINTKFESKSRRIRITNIMMKETKEEREKTVETVSRDRLYLIDAVLVRIMKARKTILHQALIPQVLEQVKVPAQSSDVKKRIESLIEREYMERDLKDHNRYNYLA